jgi:AbrB family looped-hinge helix DNA binding protein
MVQSSNNSVAFWTFLSYTESGKSRVNPTERGNYMENMIVDNAKVMSKGQITLPKEIRTRLGLSTGDRVTLVCDGDQVIMINAAVYAMKMLQKGMEGQAAVAGLDTEETIDDLVAEVRGEVEGL